MDIFLGVIVGLFVLMFLVTAHEFGHFIAARRNGVRVLEFGICFPPRAVAWVKDPETNRWKKLAKKDWDKPQEGLIFSLNWLPIGGFCQMDGESAEDTRKGTFGKAKLWAKTKILFAGVGMNWLIAFIILTVLAWTGMPNFLDNQFTIENDTVTKWAPVLVTGVEKDSPADRAGIKEGDSILAIDDKNVSYVSEITDYNELHAGEEVKITILRGDLECQTVNGVRNVECTEEKGFVATVKLNEKEADYLLGVTMASTQSRSYSSWSAPIVGAGLTVQLTAETFKGLGVMVGNLFSGVFSLFSPDANVRENGQAAISAVGDSVSGPIGIIGTLFPSFTATGATNVAFLAALISVSLACMNILPIPALDGGRWLLIAIYKLRKKKLTKETEEKIVSRAFTVLLGLIAIVTVLDIIRLFK